MGAELGAYRAKIGLFRANRSEVRQENRSEDRKTGMK
jgi:hypothetical protein